MVIGFIGDVHGRACHALSVLLIWQMMRKRKFDLVVQVGDLGVLPDLESGDIPYDRFSQWDPSVYDLCHLILAEGEEAQLARELRSHLTSTILVVAGNHDEFADIRSTVEEPTEPIPLDAHDLFACVPDGFTLEINGEVAGFCEGGNPSALQCHCADGVDVLVSHEGGFGEGAESEELWAGPKDMLAYLKVSKPRYHIFGHFHHPVGPRRVFDTECIQMSSMVSNPRDPALQVVNEGSIGALDTETGDFEFVQGDWLGAYGREGGFDLLTDTLKKING